MNFLKIASMTLLILDIAACAPKVDDGAQYVGHWVEKNKNTGRTAAIDITDQGNGNYLYAEYWRSFSNPTVINKGSETVAIIKNGTLLLQGIEPVIIKKDGSLFHLKEFSRQE